MTSTFFGVEIGSRALGASQTALEVVGNNISNVNTPGYSRQVVTLDETTPYTTIDASPTRTGQLGTGVTVAGINRVRDQFLDQRVWTANSQQGALSSLKDIVGQVETAYGEPSTTGIGAQLTNLFNTFSTLSAIPESGGVRATVVNQAQTLVSAFHNVSATLNTLTPQITSKIGVTINSINQIAGQVADLNRQIGLGVASGQTPNDLQDQRQQLVNQLSAFVDVTVTNQSNPQTKQPTGEININIGGFALVQNDSTNALPATVSAVGNAIGLTTKLGTTVPLQGGTLYGLIKATTLVTGYQTDLDTLAYNVVNATNAIHKTGYALDGTTNNAFFAPLVSAPGAASAIAVDPGILNNPDKIAAATAPAPPATFAPGNGDNASAIATLVSAPIIGNFSLDSFYNAKVAGVGSDSQTYQKQSDNQGAVVTQLTNQQSSVSGVNLDEELTNMLQYQRLYQAAARVLNMADSFINQIINGLGAGSSPTG